MVLYRTIPFTKEPVKNHVSECRDPWCGQCSVSETLVNVVKMQHQQSEDRVTVSTVTVLFPVLKPSVQVEHASLLLKLIYTQR